jgi:hypothetical protein
LDFSWVRMPFLCRISSKLRLGKGFGVIQFSVNKMKCVFGYFRVGHRIIE